MGSQKNFCLKQGTPLKGVTSTVFLGCSGAGGGGGGRRGLLFTLLTTGDPLIGEP